MYLNLLKSIQCKIIAVFINANFLFCFDSVVGPVVGKYSMDIAIKKAKEAGIGWVTAKGNTISISLNSGNNS